MRTTNKTILDLSKVQHGTFWWVDRWGREYSKKPRQPSVHGRYIDKSELALFHSLHPGETMRKRADRLKLWDKFTAVVSFQLTANHHIQYTGKKAISMWKEWRRLVFSKKGK